MANSLWPVNAVAGQPEYNGRALRQVGSVKYASAGSARPFGARSGVRPGTPDSFVGASSTQWYVDAHAGVLDVYTAAQVGPYEYAIDASRLGNLQPADQTNPRVDITWVQVADPSESDGSTSPGVVVGYTAGVPAPSPVAPAAPPRSMVLATISVPKAGGGSPTAQRQAPTLTLAGAPHQVRSDAERNALLATVGSSAVNPLWVEHVAGARAGTVERHRGSGWVVATTPTAAVSLTRGQSRGQTTSASGVISITHGLGVAPTALIYSASGFGGADQFTFRTESRTSTAAAVVVYRNNVIAAGYAFGVDYGFDWVAVA